MLLRTCGCFWRIPSVTNQPNPAGPETADLRSAHWQILLQRSNLWSPSLSPGTTCRGLWDGAKVRTQQSLYNACSQSVSTYRQTFSFSPSCSHQGAYLASQKDVNMKQSRRLLFCSQQGNKNQQRRRTTWFISVVFGKWWSDNIYTMWVSFIQISIYRKIEFIIVV